MELQEQVNFQLDNTSTDENDSENIDYSDDFSDNLVKYPDNRIQEGKTQKINLILDEYHEDDLGEFFQDQVDNYSHKHSHLSFDNYFKRKANYQLLQDILNNILELSKTYEISEGKALQFLRQQNYNISNCFKIPKSQYKEISKCQSKELQQFTNNSECLLCQAVLTKENRYSLNCLHFFCKDKCFQQYMNSILDLGNIILFKTCPMVGCKEIIGFKEVNEFYKDNQRKLVEKILFNDYIQQTKSAIQCFSPNCLQVFVNINGLKPQEIDQPSNLRCICEQQFSCGSCREEAHLPLSCSQLKKWNALTLVEEFKLADTIALLQQTTKNCPNCKVPVEKNGGCQHMQCQNCKAHFCWSCMQITTNFSHPSYCRVVVKVSSIDSQTIQDEKRKQLYKQTFNYYKHAMKQTASCKEQYIQLIEKQAELVYKNESSLQRGIQFYLKALNVLIEGKIVFAYSFVVGYFVSDEKSSYLEYLQNDLEMKINKLEFHLTQGLKELYDRDNLFKNNIEDLNLENLFDLYKGEIIQQRYDVEQQLKHFVIQLQENLPDYELFKIQNEQLNEDLLHVYQEENQQQMRDLNQNVEFNMCTDCNINPIETDYGLCTDCVISRLYLD